MDFSTFWSDIAATIVGGISLAILFFLVKERLLPVPRISGVWEVRTTTTKTTYNPYKDMTLVHQVVVWQSGTTINGTSEKIAEMSNAGPKEYNGAARTRGSLDGAIDKHYFSRSLITVHLVEEGAIRPSTALFEVSQGCDGKLRGPWYSTAGDSAGECVWTRIP